MHMTETKHGLKGLCLREYSELCLNADRFFAGLTGIYGLYLFYYNPHKTVMQVSVPFIGMICGGLPIIGAICGGLGEMTTNLKLYMILHCLWHLLAYVSIALVIP